MPVVREAKVAETKSRKTNGRVDGLTWVVSALLVVAVFYSLYFAYEFFMPLAVGIVLALVLSPVVGFASRWRVPRTISSALVLAALVAILVTTFAQLAQPATQWIEQAPTLLTTIERKLMPVKRGVEQVKEAAEGVEKATEVAPKPGAEAPVAVVVKPPSMLSRLFGGFQRTVLHLGICIIFAYFLLAYADVFQEKLINTLPRVQQKKQLLAVVQQVERDVSSYLFAITLINIGLGVTVGLGMHLLGLPNAALWGVMAFLLNFIPYFGLAVGLTVVFLVGLTNMETLSEALIAPGIYLLANGIENQFITPSLLGRRLLLNPAVIFVMVIFWGWFWGIAGALLAVPILIVLKGISNYFAPLNAFGELLSGRRAADNGDGVAVLQPKAR
jgi:predicted PurR-regulated permease PerM